MKHLKLLAFLLLFATIARSQDRTTPPSAPEYHLATPKPPPGSPFPMGTDSLDQGGHRFCRDTVERNAITYDRCKQGMWVSCRYQGISDVVVTDKIYRLTSFTTTTKVWQEVVLGGGGGGATTYTWVNYFDNDPALGSSMINGFNNTFTLSGTPIDSAAVFLNEKRLRNGNDYNISGTTITIVNNSYIIPGTVNVSRAVGSPIATLQIPNYGATNNVNVGDAITVSGALNGTLNGTFQILSKTPFTITYASNDTTAQVAITTTLVMVNRYLKYTDKLTVAYRAATPQAAYTRFNKSNITNVVFAGSSLVYGSNTYNGITDMASVYKRFAPAAVTNVVNTAVPGEATTTINSNLATEIFPNLSAGYKKNIVFVLEAPNDIIVNGANSSAAYGHMRTLIQNIKAHSSAPYVIVGDLIPISLIPDSVRLNYNALLRANHAFADGYVDFATSPYFNGSTSYTNTAAYSYDKIHPNAFGYYQMTLLAYPAICAGYGISPQSLNTLSYYQDNDFLRTNWNYNFSDIHVGSANSTDTYIGAAYTDRIKINRFGGSVDLNSTLSTYNGRQSALKLIPTIGTSTSTDIISVLYINPLGFNSIDPDKRNYVEVKDGAHTVFRLGAIDNGNNYNRLRADSANIYAGEIIMGRADAATPTKNAMIWNTGLSNIIGNNTSFITESSTGYMQVNGSNSTGINLSIANTRVLGIDARSPFSTTYVITGQGDYNYTAPNGIDFSGQGYSHMVDINRSTSAVSGGYGLNFVAASHSFGQYNKEVFGLDINGNITTNGNVNANGLATSRFDFQPGNYNFPTARFRAGTGQYSAAFHTSEFNKYDTFHVVFTTTTTLNLNVGDMIYVSGSPNPAAVPNGSYAIQSLAGTNRYQFYVPSVATLVNDTTGVTIKQAASVPDGSLLNYNGFITFPSNGALYLKQSAVIDNLAPPNNFTSNPNAVFEFASDTKGVQMVRMTAAQKAAVTWTTSDKGMHIFVTDDTAIDASTGVEEVWNGTAWKKLW